MTAAARDDGPDAYIAKPPGPCCWLGTIHKGTPHGRIETILDVPTYVATPSPATAEASASGSGSGGRRIVLYLPDVWGLSTNAQLLMDGFADAGFLTLGMDYFRGVRVTIFPYPSPSHSPCAPLHPPIHNVMSHHL